VLQQNLRHPIVLVALLAISVFVSFGVYKFGLVFAILTAVAVVAIPVACAIIAYPAVGVVVTLVAAYLIMWVIRFGINFPLGTIMDGLQALCLFGFFLRMKREQNWVIFKNPISYVIVAWIIYNFIEVANPWAASKLAWVYTVRSVALVMLMYFIFSYQIRTVRFIKFILKLWILLAVFAAVYAIKQEFFGFAQFELDTLQDPETILLYFIDGRWRKFSIFSDPVAFAYNMVTASMLCIALMWGPISFVKKLILGCLVLLFWVTMLYSGTRGAYVLVPAGLAMFALLNLTKRILIMGIVGALFFVGLIFVPTSNPSIKRFQSAFAPSEDASFNVRKMNQKRIQPFILSHPIGGGLGATGIWGQRFSPGSFLATFPPDSGYVRVAVELGWIGLALICTLMFVILREGIKNFFAIHNPQLRSICLGMVLVVFCLHIGNYPQEAIVQFPSNIYFYLAVALINVCYRIDQEAQADLHRDTQLLKNTPNPI
jgi:putative inorganic carbon (hco3(-)) transporter